MIGIKNKRSRLTVKILSVILLCMIWISIAAQDRQVGHIAGRIKDEGTSAPIDQVAIFIDNEAWGFSNPQGEYLIKNIPTGVHQVSYRRVGYEPRTKINVMVPANTTITLNVELKVQVLKLEKYTVSGEAFFREPEDAPVSAKTLDIEEIRTQPAGAYDIQRAVQVTPSVVSGSDAMNEIIIRGANYGENLFVLDGIELQNPNHFAYPNYGGGPISLITPEMVKELTLYSGAFPSRYGNKASSVLDISTRDGNEKEYQVALDASLTGYGGHIEGPITDKSSFLAFYHHGFLNLIADEIGLNADPDFQSIYAKETVRVTPTNKLTFTQLWAENFVEVAHEDSSGFTQSADGEDVYLKSGQYMLGATYKKVFKGHYSVYTLYNSHRWWDLQTYIEGKKDDDHLSTEYIADENRLGFKYSHFLPETYIGKLEPGFCVTYDYIDSDLYFRPDTTFVYDQNGVIVDTLGVEGFGEGDIDWSRKEFGTVQLGAYLQWDKQFGKLNVTAGARVDYFDYTDETTWAPTLGMKYRITKFSNLRFGLGRYYQKVDNLTLSYDERNKVLKSKYADHLVLGWDALLSEAAMFRIETYYKEYDNVFVREHLETADTLDWSSLTTNDGEAYSYGIETFFQKKLQDNWFGSIAYSWSKAYMQDYRYPDKEVPWDFDYRNVMSIVVGYQFDFLQYDWYLNNRDWMFWLGLLAVVPSDQAEISLKFRYMGGRPYTEKTFSDTSRKWYVDQETDYNSSRLPDYKRLDLHLHHHWLKDNITMEYYVEIDNIFDTKNVWDYNYNVDKDSGDHERETVYQWGRTFIAGIKIGF